MSHSNKPNTTNNKERKQTDRRNPLLRAKTPSSTDVSPKNDNSHDELSETIKLRQAYYDFDREEAEREAEARRDALEAEVYNSPEVQKRLKHLIPQHNQDSSEDKLVQSLENLKLANGSD